MDEDTKFRDSVGRNYDIVEIAADGNCLYAAIALIVYGNVNFQSTVRAEVREHILRDVEFFSSFFVGTSDEVNAQIERIVEDRQWGGQESVVAASRIYGRTIIVEQPNGQRFTATPQLQEQEYPVMYLSYHNGNHYNLLLPHSEEHVENIDTEGNRTSKRDIGQGTKKAEKTEPRDEQAIPPGKEFKMPDFPRLTYLCGRCDATAFNPTDMRVHVNVAHGIRSDYQGGNMHKGSKSSKLKAREVYRFCCYICLSRFSSKQSIKLHICMCEWTFRGQEKK